MRETELRGSPAAGASGPLPDLLTFARELLAPRVVAAETLAEATAVAFPGLPGVLPGFGRQAPMDWELRTRRRRTGRARATRSAPSATSVARARSSGSIPTPASPSRVSPTASSVTGQREAWPVLSDAVLAELTR